MARTPSGLLRLNEDLPAHPGAELIQRFRVRGQREPVTDEDRWIEHPRGEELPGPVEAVQHRHRSGDGDLAAIDLVRFDRHPGVVTGHTELQERAAPADSAQAVTDRRLRARTVDDHV